MNLIKALIRYIKRKWHSYCHVKPIYTEEFKAFSDFDRVVLNEISKIINKKDITILEVGSWMGNGSTKTFVDIIKSIGGVLYCVDTWKGNPNVSKHNNISRKYDVFNSFLYNVNNNDGGDIVKPMVMTSQDASEIIKDESIDIVFIDADHSYEEVKKDISMWIKKVVPSGIICGHDCEVRASKLEMELLERNKYVDTMEGTLEFPKIHPGTILAVHEYFGDNVTLSSESLTILDDGSTGRSSIWYHRC